MNKLIYYVLPISLILNSVILPAQKKDSLQTPVEGKLYLTALPIISYNPAFGVMVGAAASAGMYLGNPKTTLMSNGSSTATYTSKNQLMFTLKPNIYTEDNEWYITGDGRLFFSSQPTYGLGTGPQSNYSISDSSIVRIPYENGIPTGEMMEFDLIRLYATTFKKIASHLYLGLGYHLDFYTQMVDLGNDTTARPPQFSNHWLYSQKHDFDPTKYTNSGISFNAMYDSRDNMANAYSGWFARIDYRVLSTVLGSSKNASLVSFDVRKFFSVSKRKPRKVLAFWSYGQFTPTGTLPYMGLPALGYDQLGRSGRAYPQGRFRGNNLFYFETEYRFPIPVLKKYPDLFGGVVFTNITTASSQDNEVNLFEYMKPALGCGLRIMVKKEARANIVIDYGWGVDGAGAFYININETF